jgi:hypothetical protein
MPHIIDTSEIKETDESVTEWEIPRKEEQIPEYSAVIRHNIVTSPLVRDIYRFSYARNKPLQGMEEANEDEQGNFMTKSMFKELNMPDSDSFGADIDGFDDLEEEMLKYTANEAQNQSSVPPDMPGDYKPELQTITITIHQSQITVNKDLIFNLPAAVRASNVLRGASLGQNQRDEDTLLLTLSSQFLLMIRFFDTEGKVRPYVVQWWRTSHMQDQLSKVTNVGRDISTHHSGSAFALTAQQDSIRLCYCSQTPRGVMIDRIQNLVFDGTVLHSCFLDPLKDVSDDHAMLCSLMVTSSRRYVIRLFEWWIDEGKVTEHTPLLLTNDFDVPVLVFAFKQSIFMIMEKSIVLVGVNNILSADYRFLSSDFPGSFPVSFFRPTTPMIAEDPDNEVLIATEDGTIYSVVIYDDKIHIRPILRVPKISHFILENHGSQYHLIYSSDLSYGGYMIFDEITKDATATDILASSTGEMVFKWDNWAPLWDVEIVDAKEGNQELWLAHGRYLSRLRYGFPARKEIIDTSLKRAYKVFQHIANDNLYLIFSFVDKTLIFQLDEDALIDIEGCGLELVKSTIHVSSVDDICIQITEDSIIAMDFADDESILIKDLEEHIVLADCHDNVIGIITEAVMGRILVTKLTLYELYGGLNKISNDIVLQEKPNFIKFIKFSDILYAVIGSDQYLTFYRRTEDGFRKHSDIAIDLSEPHSLIAHHNIIYVSSRYGSYSVYSITGDSVTIKLSHIYTLQLESTPIDLELRPDHIVLVSKHMWRLEFGGKYPIPIVFQESKERTVFSSVSIMETKYAVLRDDGFAIVDVSPDYKPILKTIKLGKVPKKLKYISHLGIFAIITENMLIFANKYTRLEERLFCKKETKVMFENENLLCISEWVLPTTDKAFRNLLIGCSSEHGGSIKVLQPKLSKESSSIVEAYEIYNIKTPNAVLAVEQLTEKVIIYSSGCELYTSSYDQQTRKMKDSMLVNSFSSLITAIDVKDDTVLISTKDYSITKLTTDLKVIEGHCIARKVTNSVIIDSDLTVTTDKLHCTIVGVAKHECLFKAYVKFVPKVKRCAFVPVWFNSALTRFLAFGIGGDIQMYTVLNKSQLEEYMFYYKRVKSGLDKTVTMKGLWDLNSEWFTEKDINVYDADGFRNLPDQFGELLNAVSI